ncbi:hypothetical protein I4I73_16490 [Pseudonocardia sp. KRD-184]|uniref:Uncharacterized protein n=1 Tax=Pseudonocardia oceani TaxID=2792013 RepID=A0ABS6U2T4_9PSEU|nr:hypothetical protein [Pseudonocardia oceani]MBW0090380.1 hypothetical protein [Pseudonocardia oceani]MBW0097581.1 hypothetical protein [Pseudonocardia oceani]MBW0120923.1 hypothetical protein [Pseudonocardia oceani]MBW0126535.1 hypothetical protein [Pseudonocardia oceani]
MSTWIAAFVAVAAIAATYFFCVRPALRGRCAMSGTTGTDPATDRQIAELREELRMLRAQDALDDGRVTRSPSTPPTTGT